VEEQLSVNEQLIYLFLNQFDPYVSFLTIEQPKFKLLVEEYLIKLLSEKRGPNGQNNNETKTTEEPVQLADPVETSTSESVATLDWREKSGNIDWGKEE